MSTRILVGDCRDVLKMLPDKSVQMVCTSPPYFGLRNYNVAGQMGLEPTLAEYLAGMVAVFREVRRVLRDDGTCWVNMGDSYANDTKWGGSSGGKHVTALHGQTSIGRGKVDTGLKGKDLMMVPARLAIALVDDGWYLRSDIIWHKKAPMPESVTDRPTSAHEHIFLLAKQPKYFYDSDAVREAYNEGSLSRYNSPLMDTNPGNKRPDGNPDRADWKNAVRDPNPLGANQRNVWTLGPEAFPLAHFATFVTEVPRRCIKAGTSEKGACPACAAPWRRVVERDGVGPTFAPLAITQSGALPDGPGTHRNMGGRYQAWLDANPKQTTSWAPTCQCDAGPPVPCRVLDPFAGAGTVGLVAEQLGRDSILIELSPTYAAMSEERIRGDCPMFTTVEVA